MREGIPGRNDPCPCGSGKKYKRCCMRSSAKGPANVTITPPEKPPSTSMPPDLKWLRRLGL